MRSRPSSKDFQGTEKAVADAVDDLGSAGKRKDEGKICTELLTRELAQRMRARGTTCETEVSDAIADSNDFDLTVEDVAITGDKATARVRGRGGVRTLGFVRERNGWRIDSFG